MSGFDHELMTAQEAKENLDDLLKLVAQGKRRVEILDRNGECCVLISKGELDCLEKAISILSDSSEFKDICSSINQLAAATAQPAMA